MQLATQELLDIPTHPLPTNVIGTHQLPDVPPYLLPSCVMATQQLTDSTCVMAT